MTPPRERPATAGVVGWPIGHTLSPLIHQTWAAREGVDAAYLPVAVEPGYDAFACAMDGLAAAGFRGVNVTIPHKENALRYADAASDAARTIGAANMLTFAGKDGVAADNSDAAAIHAMLADAGVVSGRAFILGAGGAARAALWALQQPPLGFEIAIANRTRTRAEEIAPAAGAPVVDWADRARALEAASLVINTTSLDMAGMPPLDLPLDALPARAVVCDIVYKPLETPLLAAARTRGARVIDGLEMLMRQAAPGYLAWLGRSAEVDDDLRRRLEAALCEGGKA